MTIQVDIDQASGPVLLESIERGDQIDLQKDGRTVAKVTPAVGATPQRTPEQIAATLAAFDEMHQLAQKLNLGPFDIEQFKRDRDFGRR